MKRIQEDTLEYLRKEYPAGCRVELLKMDDAQTPPLGTCGTVVGVDAVGTIHVNWDNGCGLGVAWGADKCRKI